jgi:prepilin-type N-terminal cleavage/methylation domain-containing protein
MLKLKLLKDRGDTIVEVMIVLAVLGLAISLSYATANRSLLNTRQAQENSEATELLQNQLEALRYLSQDPPGNGSTTGTVKPYIFPVSGPTPETGLFCVDTSTNTLASLTGINPEDSTEYPAGSPCVQGNIPYYIAVAYCGIGPSSTMCNGLSSDTFVAQATWDDVLGQGSDTVTLLYRLHP